MLVILQPDLGTALMISFGAFAVLVASAAPFRYVLGGALFGAGAAVIAAAISPYRWARVTAFLDLGSDPLGGGYQVVQSLVALGTGGLWGVGLGASRARWSFLPNAHTDFIFSIIGEETGLAGSLVVILLFVALTVAGTLVALPGLRPVRPAGGHRHHHLAGHPGARQHRRRHRRAADHRRAAAVRVDRRQRPRHRDGWRSGS